MSPYPPVTVSARASWPSVLLLVGGWLVAAADPLAAAEEPLLDSLAGKPIVRVEVAGLQSIMEDTLLFYLGLREGEPYDPERLDEKVHELWERGLVDDLEIEARPLDWGVRLAITVRERPTLRSIEYEGLEHLRREEIAERISRERIRVREGEPLEMGEVHRLEAEIEALCAEKGFHLAAVDFTLEEVSSTERRLVFHVDEESRVRIGDIDFEGNTVYGDRRLRWALKQTKQRGIVAGLRKKDVYDPAALEEDLARARDLYRRAGYKNVVVGEPRIDISVGRPGAEQIERQRRRLAITIPIEEGERWRLGGITIEGNERFSDELLLQQFERPSGGWLRSDVIDDGIEAIEELYSNTGHLFVKAEPRVVERDDRVADVFVRIVEGDQFRVGRIEFEGNTKTKDEVLRREMALHEGAVLNTSALRASLLRLGQLEIFEVDREEPVAFDFDAEEQTVDVKIQGQEGEPTDLLFGGGFGEQTGFFGQIQYRTRNFLGRGETLRASAQVGEREDLYELSYLVPWFLDRPQQVGFSLFQRSLDYKLLGGQRVFEDRLGGSLTYGRRLGLFRNLSATYTLYDAEERASDASDPTNTVVVPVDRQVSMLRLGLVEDRRDSRLQPTRGGRWSLAVDWAGGALGGTTEFVRPQATFSRYFGVSQHPVRTLVAFNLEAGYIVPTGGSDLFFNDRFFLGGENSVRGFEFRSIWARDDDGNSLRDENSFALGGDRSLQLNLECHMLLGGPFRLLAFADAGKVLAEDQSFGLDHLRLSSGLELQINVPMLGAPLRLIWAHNLDPLPDDRFETFQFSIGPSF